MRQLKNLRITALVLLIAIMIVTGSFTAPGVRAQPTSITHLTAPSTALVGESVTVRVGATYDLGSNGYSVLIGIFDLDAWWAIGSAVSEENTCHTYTGQAGQEAFCAYIPSTPSGSDVVIFQLTFSTVKTYRLRASVELFYSNAQLISSASTFQDFTISVTEPQQQSPTTVQQPPSQTSQPSASAYQPEQTGFTNYDFWTQVGVIATVLSVAVALIALYFQIRRGNANTTVQQAEKGTVQQLVINSPNTTVVNQNPTANTGELFASTHRKHERILPASQTTVPQRQEILDQVLNEASPLAPLIGKTLQIAKELGRMEESRWLERELYGYEKRPDDQPTTFPEYRRIPAIVTIQLKGFTTAGPIDEEINAERTIFVSFPTSQIENDVMSARRNGSEKFVFWMPTPDDLVPPKKLRATVTSEKPGHSPFIVELGSLEKLLYSLRLSVHKFISTTIR